MATYYHFRRSHRNPGDVIDLTMRSMLELYEHGANTNPWRLVCELALEEQRLRLRPEAVSRIDCRFVFRTEEDALRQIYRMSGSKFLFEVEFTEPAAPTFTGDFDLMSTLFTMDGARFLPKVRAVAESYWRGTITGTPEVLTASNLRVIRTARAFA